MHQLPDRCVVYRPSPASCNAGSSSIRPTRLILVQDRSYIVTPPTRSDGKLDVTHSAISAASRLPPLAPTRSSPLTMYQWIFFAATSCWNRSSVGDGSEPLKPPIGITGCWVSSWYPAALLEPVIAATHVNRSASWSGSCFSSSLATDVPSNPPRRGT